MEACESQQQLRCDGLHRHLYADLTSCLDYAEASFTAHELNWTDQHWSTQLRQALSVRARNSPVRQRHDLLRIDSLQTLQRTRSFSSEYESDGNLCRVAGNTGWSHGPMAR